LILYFLSYEKKQRATRALTKTIKTTNKRITNLIMWNEESKLNLKERINYFKTNYDFVALGPKIYNAQKKKAKWPTLDISQYHLLDKFKKHMETLPKNIDLEHYFEHELTKKKKFYARNQKFYIYI